jgi:hypothetical protein
MVLVAGPAVAGAAVRLAWAADVQIAVNANGALGELGLVTQTLGRANLASGTNPAVAMRPRRLPGGGLGGQQRPAVVPGRGGKPGQHPAEGGGGFQPGNDQNPAAGTAVTPGTAVSLTEATGLNSQRKPCITE